MPEDFDLSKILARLDAKITAKKGEGPGLPSEVGEKEAIAEEQIAKQAATYLDRWVGPPPDSKGDIVKAFINNGNPNSGITSKHLSEWLPGYTPDDLLKLGQEIRAEARRRDQKEGGDRWRFAAGIRE